MNDAEETLPFNPRKTSPQAKPYTHGHATRGSGWTQEFQAWRNMICRCMYPKTPCFKNYGARGITICDRWLNSFSDFLADIGTKPTRLHSLNRKNNDSHYSCGRCEQCLRMGWVLNCEWSTKVDQDNNKRSNRFLELDGRRMTVSQWSRQLGMNPKTILNRISYGWSDVRVLTTPVETKYFTRERKPNLASSDP